MDNKIIFSTREISVFIKIKTEDTGFDIMKYLDIIILWWFGSKVILVHLFPQKKMVV